MKGKPTGRIATQGSLLAKLLGYPLLIWGLAWNLADWIATGHFFASWITPFVGVLPAVFGLFLVLLAGSLERDRWRVENPPN